jgi:signal transduction histidine kinase
MASLSDIFKLLAQPPGSLVFHLIALFALTFMLYAALGQRRAHGTANPFPRLHWAAAILLLGRVLLMIAALLENSGVVLSHSVLPPLERFVDVASIGLLALAFVPLLIDKARFGLAIASLNAAAALIAYAAVAPAWYAASQQSTATYSEQDWGWQIWSLGIAALAAVLTLFRRGSQWATVLVAFAALAAGHGLQAVLPDVETDVAIWVRLAQLVAYLLLAATVFAAYTQTRHETEPRPASAERLMPGAPDPWPVVDAIRQVGSGDDRQLALQRVCAAIASHLRADLTAIGLPGNAPHLIELVAIHHPGAAPTPGAMFTLDEQPAVKRAIDRRRSVLIGPQDNASDISGLFGLLGSFVPGPLLIQPLIDEQDVLGVLLVGNPNSGRALAALDAQQARAHGDLLSRQLAMARQIDSLQRRGAELSETVRQQVNELSALRAIQASASQLSQNEAAQLTAALREAEQRAEQANRRAQELAAFIQAREAETQPIDDRSALWEAQVRRLSDERGALETQLAEAREEAAQLASLQQALEAQLKQAQQHIAGLQDDLERRAVAGKTGPLKTEPEGDAPGILVSDTRGRIAVANERALRLIGRPRTALVGQSIESVFSDRRWREALDLLTRAPDPSAAGEPPFVIDVAFAGRTLHAELTPFRDGSGRTLNGIIVSLLGEAERSDTQRQEVLASIAQELRTPMTSIVGYTDLLLGESVGILGAMQRQFLQRVRANIERMGGLLNDLIGVATLDTGQVKQEPEPIDITEAIEEAIMAASAQVRERGTTIQLDLEEDLPRVEADRDNVQQILSHLLTNAVTATPPGGDVVIGAHSNPEATEFVLISVTDCGGGIDPQDRQRVFNRLYRADNPLIGGLGETGVGMSIARALVEAQGGRIWVDSEMGRGSTFTFIIPVAGMGESGNGAGP